ncbi:myeloid-derived growth factor isoform X2 [Delphinapterus leucas]|uniref:Myeloid-derived growth factor isoform X2 n=1 Tax=Delphinapterus leucas TaxID=9749 RepID=A0A2Y9LSL7_DELLE|nr:myeloid-derived growth factor isoform X2 [Delphinapterus leucas]
MAAPSRRRNGGGGAMSLWAALLLVAVALRPARAVSEPTTVAFDVRPGGVVHSFSQNVGPGDKYTCVFTYASQGGTNENPRRLSLSPPHTRGHGGSETEDCPGSPSWDVTKVPKAQAPDCRPEPRHAPRHQQLRKERPRLPNGTLGMDSPLQRRGRELGSLLERWLGHKF